MNDHLIDALVPTAAALVVAVDEQDRDAVGCLLSGHSATELHALAILLAAHVDPDKPFRMTAGHVTPTREAAHHAAIAFGVPITEIFSQSRRREAVDARGVACYVGRLLGQSQTAIGQGIDRERSTVLHAIGRVGETPRLRRIAERIATEMGWDRNQREDVA